MIDIHDIHFVAWSSCFVLSSTNKAESMIQSRAHPRWMHTYAFNFWAIPTLASFQKIHSQRSWSGFSALMGQRSVHIGKSGVSADAGFAREWKDFLPPILWFVCQDASFHENVRSHEYLQLLGQSSTRCKDPIFIKELMLKPSLGVPSTTWDYHMTNVNITRSVNQDREARETDHSPIASLSPYWITQPIHLISYVTSGNPSPEYNKMK